MKKNDGSGDRSFAIGRRELVLGTTAALLLSSRLAFLATVEQPQDRLDDPARVLMVFQGDGPLIEVCFGIVRGMLAAYYRVTAEILVAGDLRQPPARIVAAAQSILFGGDIVSDYYHQDIAGMPEIGTIGRQL